MQKANYKQKAQESINEDFSKETIEKRKRLWNNFYNVYDYGTKENLLSFNTTRQNNKKKNLESKNIITPVMLMKVKFFKT